VHTPTPPYQAAHEESTPLGSLPTPCAAPSPPSPLPVRRDGRYALFVAADIAVYDAGVARPTGGVGAVACLVGPNAPLRLLPRSRVTHAVDTYDFYKPSLSSEYPAVDGKLSQVCYLKAVDDCYGGHLDKVARNGLHKEGATHPHGLPTVDSAYDHMLFHSPYNKLVQQSYKRMLYNDARRLAAAGLPLPPHLAALAPFATLPVNSTYSNRDLDKVLGGVGGELYAKSVRGRLQPLWGVARRWRMCLLAWRMCLLAWRVWVRRALSRQVRMWCTTSLAVYCLPSPHVPLCPGCSRHSLARLELCVHHLFLRSSAPRFPSPLRPLQVGPSVAFSQNIGNSYTGALWANLASIVDAEGSALEGRRLGMFSYGSGALATMFALDAAASAPAAAANPAFSVGGIKSTVDLSARLEARKEASPEEFTAALALREAAYGKSGYTPVGSVDNVPGGAWYLKEVTPAHTRVYERKA